MNPSIDNRTLLVVAGSLYVLLPMSIWLILKMPRRLSSVLWCVGNMVGGAGLVLMGLREQIDDFISYVVGQPMLAVGALLTAQSLRLDLERPWAWRWVVAFALVYIAGLCALLSMGNVQILGMFIRLFNLAAITALVVSAWQLGQTQSSRNAVTIAWAYLVQGLGVVVNQINDWLGSSTLHGESLTAVVSLITLVIVLVAAMAYLGLALERSIRCNLALSSELARAEQWNTRRQELIVLDRSRTMSMLAGSLGHAIAQPLTSALIRLQTPIKSLEAGVPLARPLLQQVVDQAIDDLKRAIETIQRIRHFVRPRPPQHSRIEINHLLQDVQKLMGQEAINQGVRLEFSLGEEPLWIVGDALLISHAVLQIVRNAMAAVAPGPLRQIRVMIKPEQKQVRIEVQDTGCGFSDAILARPFNHLGTAHQTLQGIGLFVVNSIAQQHHGQLLLENLPSGGARVSLVLPSDSSDSKHRDARTAPHHS